MRLSSPPAWPRVSQPAARPGRLESTENFFVSRPISMKFHRRRLGGTGRVSRKFQPDRSTLKFSLARGPGELAANRDAWPAVWLGCPARGITVHVKLFCFSADLDEISQALPRGDWPNLQKNSAHSEHFEISASRGTRGGGPVRLSSPPAEAPGRV